MERDLRSAECLTNTEYQRWSSRGRPWPRGRPRGRPRGHIFEFLGLGLESQVLGLDLEASSSRKLPCPRL